MEYMEQQMQLQFEAGNAVLEQNKQLQQELSAHKPNTSKLADLAEYCVQRNIGQIGQDAHKAIIAHCDAQAAHLHNLHEALKAFSNVKAPGGFARDTREYDKAMGKCWQNLWAVVNTTPQDALLAVKAEAARAGWVACALQLTDEPMTFIKPYADQYAEQVLKGEVKL